MKRMKPMKLMKKSYFWFFRVPLVLYLTVPPLARILERVAKCRRRGGLQPALTGPAEAGPSDRR